MRGIGIQCCFDPICYKTVETQTDQTGNASNSVSESIGNELPLPGQDGAHVSVHAVESKVKHDHVMTEMTMTKLCHAAILLCNFPYI